MQIKLEKGAKRCKLKNSKIRKEKSIENIREKPFPEKPFSVMSVWF